MHTLEKPLYPTLDILAFTAEHEAERRMFWGRSAQCKENKFASTGQLNDAKLAREIELLLAVSILLSSFFLNQRDRPRITDWSRLRDDVLLTNQAGDLKTSQEFKQVGCQVRLLFQSTLNACRLRAGFMYKEGANETSSLLVLASVTTQCL